MNKQCELKGQGLGYLQQVSLDDGKTWFPQEGAGLVPKPGENGLETILIPNLPLGKKILKARLRDFPKSEISLPVK